MWATQEQIDGDPDQYDCQSCQVWQRLEGLDQENRQAWTLFRQFAVRLTADAQCGGYVLERLTANVPDEDWPAVWRRLCLLYDVLSPPPPTQEP